MSEQEQQRVSVGKAPAYVRVLLENKEVTIPIATAFDAIENVMLEAQRNIVGGTTPKEDLPAVIIGIDHLLKHFRLCRDQGVLDIKNREK